VFLEGVHANRAGARVVGRARTLRFIPFRPDLFARKGGGYNAQKVAFDTVGPGEVLVIDARGERGTGTVGDVLALRAQARGAAGIVTDGGFRDTNGIFKTGLPAYHRRPSSPPSPIVHRPIDLQLPIACGGVAVYPGDIVVGDRDAVLVIPPDVVEAVADEAVKNYEYEEFAELEVARGRSLKGLFPAVSDEAKRDYEEWKKKGGKK